MRSFLYLFTWAVVLSLVFLLIINPSQCRENHSDGPRKKINENELLMRNTILQRQRRAAQALGAGPQVATFFYANRPESGTQTTETMTFIDRRKYEGLPLPPQRIRLRGEIHRMGHSEGRVEIYDEESRRWGVICDDYWTINDASVACHQLGFPNGAGLIYTGDHFGPGPWDRADFLYTSIQCEGDEKSLQDCSQDLFQLCTGKTAALTCFINEGCPKGWLSYKGICYHVTKEAASFLDSAKYCADAGGTLAYVLNEEENNFLSNTIMTKYKNFTDVWIGGYYNERMGPNGNPEGQWSWYETIHRVHRSNLWFPGFKDMPNTKSPRTDPRDASCIMMKRVFADPLVSNAFTSVDYFWWDNESCRKKAPSICQKPIPSGKTECYKDRGVEYRGTASRTLHDSICASWADPKALVNTMNAPGKGLGEHNYCRNPDNDIKPWCWVNPAANIFGYCKLERCDRLPEETVTPPISESQPGFNNSVCVNDTFHCPSLLGIKPYKPCVERSKVCNGVVNCPLKEDENPEVCKTLLCNKDEFYCASSQYCISKRQVCDGLMDCQHGEDEVNCTINTEDALKFYQELRNCRLDVAVQTYSTLSLTECAMKCTTALRRNFNCIAFNYKPTDENSEPPESICELNEKSHREMPSSNLTTKNGFTYYVLKNTCDDGFRCWNGNCVPRSTQCNGVDDCGDLSDEKRCATNTSVFPPFKVRLSDGRGAWEGRVEVRYEGEWGVVCDDGFDIEDANVICKQLGFATAVAAVHNSWERFGQWNGNVLLSGLKCSGNESSIQFCKHNGWQDHNCGGDEAAGVECMISRACTSEEFRCYDGKGCVSNTKFCDGKRDCLDGSDENADCSLKVRLKGPNKTSGLVYVSRGFMSGTVCEDEFDDLDAEVICRMLHFHGKARAVKDGRFGRGSGVVMLDNLRCLGTENSLMDCPDFAWASHNCDNTEDVGVECDIEEHTTTTATTTAITTTTEASGTTILMTETATTTTQLPATTTAASSILCGERPIEQLPPRFAGGFDALQGAFPWQVGIRKKRPGREDTSHHCGGTIISEYWIVSAAHCFSQPKTLFKVRVGDWNNLESSEKYEMEFEIDELYLHPKWAGTKTFDYDLALIKVRAMNGRGIQFSEEVQAACLPMEDTLTPSPTQKCYVSGWGFTKREYPDVLKAAVMPLIPQEECNAMYKGAITDRMVCAGFKTGGLDACSGDSGGPLVCLVDGVDKHVLWGATSFGRGCGEPNRPGVYAKVKSMLDWVLKTAVN